MIVTHISMSIPSRGHLGGKLGLLTPERVDLPGRRSADGPEARENYAGSVVKLHDQF